MKRCYILLLIVFSAYFVSAEKPADINVFQKDCFANGSVSFTARNYYHEELFLKDVEVKLIDPEGAIIPLKGRWNKEYIKGDYCYDENPIQYADFSSEVGMANLSGDYQLVLHYLKCEKTPCENCEEIFPFNGCPGYQYSCQIAKPNISCFNRGGAAHILFNGINKNQFTKIDPDKDALFELEGLEDDFKKLSRTTSQ